MVNIKYAEAAERIAGAWLADKCEGYCDYVVNGVKVEENSCLVNGVVKIRGAFRARELYFEIEIDNKTGRVVEYIIQNPQEHIKK